MAWKVNSCRMGVTGSNPLQGEKHFFFFQYSFYTSVRYSSEILESSGSRRAEMASKPSPATVQALQAKEKVLQTEIGKFKELQKGM